MSDDPADAENKMLKAAYHEDPATQFEAFAEEFEERAQACYERLEAMDEGEYDDYTKGCLDAYRSAATAARMCQFAIESRQEGER